MSSKLPADVAAAVMIGGEAGRCFAATDWDHHRLGPVRSWPTAFQTMVSVALASRFPVVLWLGDELSVVYNDGYIPMLGDKHPWAMGKPGLEVWYEIRDIIEPMLRSVVETQVATWSDDLLLMLVDHGRPWERYFTFTYSPIMVGSGEVGGVFCAVNETTERVVGERRLRALNALGAALVECHSVAETCTATVTACSQHSADVPFVALYLHDSDTGRFSLEGASPPLAEALSTMGSTLSFWVPDAPAEAVATVVGDAAGLLAKLGIAWEGSCPERAIALPLNDQASTDAMGWLVIGLNPHRHFDDQYRGFCRLLADQVSAGMLNARAYEAERTRAESLAELDRAKTMFLTNVSHEFRTPLALMLGPLEEAMALVGDEPQVGAQLAVAHRSSRRLLKLVNSLLEFARIEAGRASPHLVRTDVGALTADIAASFSDICLRAGLEYELDCAPAVGLVDAEMWETIVSNLISNAFKFTFTGSIAVHVQPDDDETIVLTVADTGIGIAEGELTRIFERFYRPHGSRGRSVEGSGIGLALVDSLVQLHGGDITVASREGEGTTFTVRIPVGRVSSGGTAEYGSPRPPRSNVYVTEAAHWLNQEDGGTRSPQELPPAHLDASARPLVLIADDNADLRAHLERIIGARWHTVTAPDGRVALELARQVRPDLIIADVMMPNLDGFGLVRALRRDSEMEHTPVILLTARAGTESSGEGFEAGADDYVVKPFQSSDLLNRVAARLKLATRERIRRRDEQERVDHASALADVSSRLAAAANRDEIADALIASRLPLRPDAAAIAVIEDDGDILRMVYAGGLVPEITDRYHVISMDAPVPVAKVARSGRPVVIPDTFAMDPAYDAVVADTASSIRAAIIEPLLGADGGIIGALSLMWRLPRSFPPSAVGMVAEEAELVAKALERIERISKERQIAIALQDRLLQWGTRSTAAAIATTYLPSSDDMRVGGDWFTVTSLDVQGRIGLSVGDVGGHGLGAATVMSELRSALAAASLAVREPSDVLDLLERYARQIPGASCTTVAYVAVDPSRHQIAYACAGHPYPVVVGPAGTARMLEDGRRPPLAAASIVEPASQGSSALLPGSLLILYTDGLVERRGESLEAGLDRLLHAATSAARKPVSAVCAELVAALKPPSGFEDDVVVVALRPCGESETSFVEVVRAETSVIPSLRSRLRSWLYQRNLEQEAVYNVLVCAGEAVNNAIEHGSGFNPEHTVTLEAHIDDNEISVTVSDSGRWSADSARSRRLSTRGRGLTLIHGLSATVSIDRGVSGTAVTMTHPVVLAPARRRP